jgi:hypothetical protein
MKIKTITITIFATLLLVTAYTFAQKGSWKWGNDNVQTISGTITDNDRPCGFLKADDGKIYKIHLGPVWYWTQNDYALTLTSATIKGNVKEVNGEYDIYPYTITQNSKTMTFTDENGIPKWSQGKGNGNGRGNCYGKDNGNGNGWGRGNCGKCPCRNK